jgi:hypothetical protein
MFNVHKYVFQKLDNSSDRNNHRIKKIGKSATDLIMTLLHPFPYHIATHTLAVLLYLFLKSSFLPSFLLFCSVTVSTHLCLDDKIHMSYISCQLRVNKPWLDILSASPSFSVPVLKSLTTFSSVTPYSSHNICPSWRFT